MTAPEVTGTLHLTHVGPAAGTYFCGAFGVYIGCGMRGERLPQDRGVHYAHAPEAVLVRGNVTPDGKRTCDACLDAVEAAA